MTPEQIAWLAGIIEGEGCVDAPRGNIRLRIKMTDLDVILRAATLMGCPYFEDTWGARNHGHKPSWVAQISGERAAAVLRLVLPYMGTRRTAKIADLVGAHDIKTRAKARAA